MELYIHIPFCIRKCNYCDFLSAPADEHTIHAYLQVLKEQLIKEAALFAKQPVTSVFIGGGTPSILTPLQITELMDSVFRNYTITSDAEITMEANPGTLNRDKIKAMAESRINRVSLGLQSGNEQELKKLGRIHTWKDFQENYLELEKQGIYNINVDLMSALPGQTTESWKQTLKQVLDLEPRHISAYSLIIEEGTPFFKQYGEDEVRREKGEIPEFLPSEEVEREMYQCTSELLNQAGYERYEISNYAKAGFLCRHNEGYWRGTPYLGIGLGAASYMDGYRYSNTRNLKAYLEKDFSRQELCHLSTKQKMEEFMFLGLRMTSGVEKEEFKNRFQEPIETIYGNIIEELKQKHLIEESKTHLKLTGLGTDVSNYVLSNFLIDEM